MNTLYLSHFIYEAKPDDFPIINKEALTVQLTDEELCVMKLKYPNIIKSCYESTIYFLVL